MRRGDKSGIKRRAVNERIAMAEDGEVNANPRRKALQPSRIPRSVACGKLEFPDQAAAEHKARELTRLKSDKTNTPYLCPACHKWHLTTTRDGYRKDGSKIRKRN